MENVCYDDKHINEYTYIIIIECSSLCLDIIKI